MNNLGKTKHRIDTGDRHDPRLDSHISGIFEKKCTAKIKNTPKKQKTKNKRHNFHAISFISQDDLEMIDSILQPYCEDFLIRESIVEDITRIIVNGNCK